MTQLTEIQMREWVNKIPHVQFNPEWDVRAIPAFGGAVIRYMVRQGDLRVSVYLDAYDNIGSVGQPYWEIYPNAEGDTDRILLNETADLVEAIANSFAERTPS